MSGSTRSIGSASVHSLHSNSSRAMTGVAAEELEGSPSVTTPRNRFRDYNSSVSLDLLQSSPSSPSLADHHDVDVGGDEEGAGGNTPPTVPRNKSKADSIGSISALTSGGKPADSVAKSSRSNASASSSAARTAGGHQSESSESLCNFANSTPYRVDPARAGAMVFSSDERSSGGRSAFGSPSSAFSPVGTSFIKGIGIGANGDVAEEGGTVPDGGSGRRVVTVTSSIGAIDGDEGSMLSPRSETERRSSSASIRNREATPYVARAHHFSTGDSTHGEVPSSFRTNHQSAGNPHGRDPTPVHARFADSIMSPTGSVSSLLTTPRSNTSHVPRSDGSERSQQSSRSGRDPPANSPFPSSVAAHHCRPTSASSHHSFHSQGHNAHQNNDDHELSRIEEDASILDDVSAVSAFTSATHTPLNRRVRGGGGVGMVSSLTATLTGGTGGGGESVTGSRTPLSSSSAHLRRTSQIMRDKVAELATETAHELEQIWDVVGTGPDDRAAQLDELVDQLCDLCESKVANERGLVDVFRKEIANRRAEWTESCRALRLDERDPPAELSAFTDGENVPLQVELEALEAELENIRAMREAAGSELKVSQKCIIETHAALNGCSLEEAACSKDMAPWSDVNSDLTQERRIFFSAKAAEMKETLNTRTKAVVSLLRDCQNLIYDLKIGPRSHTADGDDNNGSVEYEDYYPGGRDEVGRSEDDAKIMKSLVSARNDGREDSRRRRSGGRASSDYTVASPFESSTCTGVGKDALDRLTNRLAELNGEKERRRRKLQEMGGKISILWTKLKIPDKEQRAISLDFQASGLGIETIRKGERELVRLHELKTVMNGELIQEQRKKIEMLWAQINASDEEKASFDRYFHIDRDEELTDELLHEHEEYVSSLNAKLEQMKPILELIAKRESILSDRFELEIQQRDPDRLKQRGANLTKQLMREERMSRRVKKELPKITQLLEKKLMEWCSEHRSSVTEDIDSDSFFDSSHFMYNNEPYLKTIHVQENDWKMRKELGELERQRKRHDEISASATTAFGSTYAKLPGKKWHPSGSSKVPRNSTKPSGPSDLRPRSASTMRGQPLSDVSSSRQNSRASSRPKNHREKKHAKGGTTQYTSGSASSRAQSAPRMR